MCGRRERGVSFEGIGGVRVCSRLRRSVVPENASVMASNRKSSSVVSGDTGDWGRSGRGTRGSGYSSSESG